LSNPNAAVPTLILVDDVLYDAKDASIFLGRSPSSLAKDRVFKVGCPWIKVSASVRYRGADIRQFIAAARIVPTANAA
jgi:hypothetical protein